MVGEARRRSGRRRRRDGVDVGRARCDTGDVAPATAEISRRRRGRRSMRRSDAFQCASSPVSGRPVSSSPRPGAFSRHLRREKPLIEARPHLWRRRAGLPRGVARESRACSGSGAAQRNLSDYERRRSNAIAPSDLRDEIYHVYSLIQRTDLYRNRKDASFLSSMSWHFFRR